MTNEGGRRTSGQWSVYQYRGYVGGRHLCMGVRTNGVS